jgi:hypothetical protein
VSNFPSSQDQIGHTQAGDSSTKKMVKKHDPQKGVVSEERIFLPQVHPGKHDKKDSDLQTVENIDNEEELI